MVTDLDALDPRADLLDDPRPLVTEHHWQGNGIVLVADMDIGLADADSTDPDEHFVRTGLVQLKIAKNEWTGFLFDNGCTHSHDRSSIQRIDRSRGGFAS
ncbi:hypothetical protein H681_06375 [Pseudomonas sp. ATCC 13867]|nr:hypothetical protein H681_06375 [Pseudomonas sp. ATCC 13867]